MTAAGKLGQRRTRRPDSSLPAHTPKCLPNFPRRWARGAQAEPGHAPGTGHLLLGADPALTAERWRRGRVGSFRFLDPPPLNERTIESATAGCPRGGPGRPTSRPSTRATRRSPPTSLGPSPTASWQASQAPPAEPAPDGAPDAADQGAPAAPAVGRAPGRPTASGARLSARSRVAQQRPRPSRSARTVLLGNDVRLDRDGSGTSEQRQEAAPHLGGAPQAGLDRARVPGRIAP